MSQKDTILSMFKSSLTGIVSCRELAGAYLFHKAASRISELRKLGYNIQYVQSVTDSPMDAYYILMSEPQEMKFEGEQRVWA